MSTSEDQQNGATSSSDHQAIAQPQQDEAGGSSSRNNVIALASKQISNVIEFQEPSTSTNYSFKTEIRINILGEPKPSQRSVDTDDSVTLSLFNDDFKPKKEPVEMEESFTTMDNCIKEKMTSTNEAALFSRNERTQRTILVNSEAPPPYDSHPPPPYSASVYHAAQRPYQPTNLPSTPGDNNFYPDGYRYPSFLDLQIRHLFIKKVFFILFVQLMITTSFILLAMFHQPSRKFIITNMAMFYVMLALELIIYIVLVCCEGTRRIFPLNFILLLLFTISLSYITAALTIFYDTKVIVTTAASTGLICLVMSLLACQTRYDITKWNFVIAMASFIFVIFSLIVMIVSIFAYSLVLWLVYSGLTTMLFSVYLIYDMQLIFGGRHHELSTEEYIYGALTLFVDIIMIFVYMLHLVNACSR